MSTLEHLRDDLKRDRVPYYEVSNELLSQLTDEERAKYERLRSDNHLAGTIRDGLMQCAMIFSPRRLRTRDQQAEVWFDIFAKLGEEERKRVAGAFEQYKKSGKRYPVPAQILALVAEEPGR